MISIRFSTLHSSTHCRPQGQQADAVLFGLEGMYQLIGNKVIGNKAIAGDRRSVVLRAIRVWLNPDHLNPSGRYRHRPVLT